MPHETNVCTIFALCFGCSVYNGGFHPWPLGRICTCLLSPWRSPLATWAQLCQVTSIHCLKHPNEGFHIGGKWCSIQTNTMEDKSSWQREVHVLRSPFHFRKLHVLQLRSLSRSNTPSMSVGRRRRPARRFCNTLLAQPMRLLEEWSERPSRIYSLRQGPQTSMQSGSMGLQICPEYDWETILFEKACNI